MFALAPADYDALQANTAAAAAGADDDDDDDHLEHARTCLALFSHTHTQHKP